ncbi:hypothetical protein CAPTEDRAFT_229386 [Capitella teleta]|uniref:Uncharacterized protein n=1 Tax=Capitella teleta TaxID=283909 RepID=R7VHU2_CAPTE|nr:hypothetical protein CAPTEDRAFT_229386 [Capitella teleta]|eukprot:ELU18137.1 hypothetical protein CAPTEDRAFT_229386 [Capitella teleta]
MSSKKPRVTATACGRALSYWNKTDIWVCLHEGKAVRCQDFIDVMTSSDVPEHYDEIRSVLHGDSRPKNDAWAAPAVVLLDTGSSIAFSLASPYSLTTIGYRTTKLHNLCLLHAQITRFFMFWFDIMVACRDRRAFIPAASKRLRTVCLLMGWPCKPTVVVAVAVAEEPNKAQLTSDPDNVEDGKDLRLTCFSTSNSLPEDNHTDVQMIYKWTRNDQDVDPDDPPDRHSFPDSDHSVLRISPVEKGDTNAFYKCIGQEEGSRLESDPSDHYALDVLYAPGAASIQGDSSAVAGDDVITLVCSTDDRGNPQGTYYWKKPNGGTQTGKNLNIENLNVDEDEGEYECYVENDVAQGTSATHTLTVNSVPGVEQDLDSEKSVVNTDDSFSVSCAFRAKPAASVVWKREDDSALPSHIFSTSSTQQADGKFTITTSTLTWSGTDADARRGQGGKMFCAADNGIRNPVKSNTMDLIIQYAPYGLSITPGSSSVELNEGDNLPDRVCSANCEPSCLFTWHFNSEDGGVVENSDTLSMQNVQRGEHGSYFCKASNGIQPSAHDNFKLIVNYGPEIEEFKTTPQDGSIIESNSTTFSCSVVTRPGASIRLTGPQGLSESKEDETKLQHTIHDIGCKHSGTYTCTSNNKETGKEMVKTVDVQVKCSPTLQMAFPEDRIHGVTEGASVYFFVEALSHPTPDFQWKRTFNNGTNVNLPSHDSGNKSNLTITNIKIEDFGNYTVSAHNYIGHWEDIKFELRALGRPFRIDESFLQFCNLAKPQPPTKLSSKATAKSLTLSWTPGWDGGPPQTFTITYSTDGFEITIPGILDSPHSTRISYKLTEGISAEKSYSVEIFATNSQGSSEVVLWEPITTPQGDDVELTPKHNHNGMDNLGHNIDDHIGQDGELTVDNDLYQSNGIAPAEYAEIDPKTKKVQNGKKAVAPKPDPKDVYAQVNNPKKNGGVWEDDLVQYAEVDEPTKAVSPLLNNEPVEYAVVNKPKKPKQGDFYIWNLNFYLLSKARVDESSGSAVNSKKATSAPPPPSPYEDVAGDQTYAQVNKKPKKPSIGAKPKKPIKPSKPSMPPPRENPYEDVSQGKKFNPNEESVYQNCGQPDETYANVNHANQFVSEEGIVYAEVEVDPPTDQNVIHGGHDQVDYAQIDYTKT